MNFYQDKIKGMDFSSVDPSIEMRSRSGVRFSQSRQAQAFEVSVSWSPMPNQDIKALNAALISLRGQVGALRLSVPLLNRHVNASGEWLCNATAPGSNAVVMVTYYGTLTVGSVVNFAGHDKLYMITSQENETVTFAPPLRRAITENSILNYSAPTLLCVRKNDSLTSTFTRKNSALKDTFEEVLA